MKEPKRDFNAIFFSNEIVGILSNAFRRKHQFYMKQKGLLSGG